MHIHGYLYIYYFFPAKRVLAQRNIEHKKINLLQVNNK